MIAEHETDPALLGRVHFIGMGGAGMSAVAKLMLARGVPVSGSDRQDSPALRQLQDLGATVHVGQRAEHVDGAQTVVVSTAIPPEDPEYSAARAAGLPCVAVSFGFNDRPADELGADAVIDHFDELIPALEAL